VAERTPPINTTAWRVWHVRTAAGLSSRQLSRAAGLADPHVAHIERGGAASHPRTETLAAIAGVLGIDATWLVFGGPERPSAEALRAVGTKIAGRAKKLASARKAA